MSQNRRPVAFLVAALALLLHSCMTSPYYQENIAPPQQQWSYEFKPVFSFQISDTTPLYNLYFDIRHTDAYPFSNIWVRFYTRQPGDTAWRMERREVQLAAPSGQWLGRGMGEIYEQRMALGQLSLSRKGRYQVRLEQDMRQNPLPQILQVGIRVERGAPKME